MAIEFAVGARSLVRVRVGQSANESSHAAPRTPSALGCSAAIAPAVSGTHVLGCCLCGCWYCGCCSSFLSPCHAVRARLSLMPACSRLLALCPRVRRVGTTLASRNPVESSFVPSFYQFSCRVCVDFGTIAPSLALALALTLSPAPASGHSVDECPYSSPCQLQVATAASWLPLRDWLALLCLVATTTHNVACSIACSVAPSIVSSIAPSIARYRHHHIPAMTLHSAARGPTPPSRPNLTITRQTRTY